MKLKKNIKNVLLDINKKSDMFEFNKIFKVIRENITSSKPVLVDIGSGLCDFSLFISKEYSEMEINCLDINNDLVNLAISYNFKAIKGEITNLPYPDNSFDITHCSHVIEHLKYPDVIIAIEELVRITKQNGLIIIRSPLWINHRFYNDIDHIRPYPPESIINYFTNPQQQNIGKQNVTEVTRWYTKIYFEINYNRFPYKIVKYFNILLKLSWKVFAYPTDRPNNYGLVLRKEKIND